MTDFPLFWLVMITLLLVVGFAAYGYVSVRRRQKYGAATKGIGGDKDPIS